ncbi:MAG TPA: phosphopyruvate hydratase [Mycobacteriales bacterium]|nr:phosphopyruvate hydratase [Mycobacteriales bacterium]
MPNAGDRTIRTVAAREVLDCRGLPTVQVDVVLADGSLGRADVPSGRSTGAYEARELRDGGSRYGGYGVRQAVANVVDVLGPGVAGWAADSQRALDRRLVELDGTPDKSALGANALLGVSLAAARASAASAGLPLYRYLNADGHLLPVPLVNLINGGRHAAGQLQFQEFIVVPIGAPTFGAALAESSEVNLALADVLEAKYGRSALALGDEGGYVPQISDPREALELLHAGVDKAGHTGRFAYGLDCAATHFYDADDNVYRLAGKAMPAAELLALYLELIQDFGIVTIEDPFAEDDFESFAALTAQGGIQIVGDDLFVTNSARLLRGIAEGAANALLWKVNQIGTLSEAMDAAAIATGHGYAVCVSERSGETEDPIIADLVVALNAGQIKTGAPVRGERTSKYNRLLQIEEELGVAARYPGPQFPSTSVSRGA